MPLEVNNCCFFIELRTGSLIIGYLNLIWNCIRIGLLIASMVYASEVAAEAKDKDTETAALVALAILGVALIFVIADVIFSVLLLLGIYKNKRGCVKAYLIYTSIFIVFAIIDFFISIIGKAAAPGDIVINLFTLLFSIYYLVVIRSYFLKMDNAPPMMQA